MPSQPPGHHSGARHHGPPQGRGPPKKRSGSNTSSHSGKPRGKVIVHFVRHAQSEHNVGLNPHRVDPPLTPQGEHQCIALKEAFADRKIDFVIASPMRRTLQTAHLGFGGKTSKIIVLPELREFGEGPGSTSMGTANIKSWANKNGIPVDFQTLYKGWEADIQDKDGYPPSPQRARFVLKALWKLAVKATAEPGENKGKWYGVDVAGKLKREADMEIVVVAHGAFLSTFPGNHDPRFRNADHLTCLLERPGLDGRVHMFETPESRKRRHQQFGTPPPRSRRRKLGW